VPKKKVLVLYEYFYPGFRAGGPVQSLVNMIVAMHHQYDFYVATTAYDLQAKQPYQNITLNQWVTTTLSNTNVTINIWYANKPKPSFKELLHTIKSAGCNTIYINGFYTNHFLFPLLYIKLGLIKNIDCIVATRGMLHKGALQIKSFQKKIYFTVLKFSGLMKSIRFHATTLDEESEIKQMFGKNATVTIAANIPKHPLSNAKQSLKQANQIKLVFISRILSIKNLLLVLQYLQQIKKEIVFDIYGTIEDENYWQQCLQAIQQLPANIQVKYKGEVLPHLVQETFMQYDAMILLTKGENFGHAIYESLSVGTPVIISNFTPWKNLQQQNAGWNVAINDEDEINSLLNNLCNYTDKDFQQYCNGAWQLANNYYHQSDYISKYSHLFL
jgi:glycosyltransferase involved in cell wall biosynthesis